MSEPRFDRRNFQAEFEAIFDAAVEAMVIINDRGIIEAFSRSAEQMFGYAAADVIGRNVSVLMPSPYHENHDTYLANYKHTRTPKIIGIGREVRGRRKDGSEFPVYLSVGEIKRESGIRFLGILQDLSERYRSATEIRELQERLAHAGRVSAMGQMATGIAHEINQPLTAIASYAQACKRMLETNTPADRRIAETIGKITDEALRAGDIIRRVRSFVRKQQIQARLCDVEMLVSEVLQMVELDARLNEIDLRVDHDPDLPPVRADGVQIQQVILNLIHNAMEAMKGNKKTTREIRIRLFVNDQGELQVAVCDRGRGVDPNVAKELFDPYVTTKSTGMGLGLSLSRTIIEGHEGRIWFEPNSDRGVTFHFTLPLEKR